MIRWSFYVLSLVLAGFNLSFFFVGWRNRIVDAKVEVSPRDIVHMENAEPINCEEPEILHTLHLSYGYVLRTLH